MWLVAQQQQQQQQQQGNIMLHCYYPGNFLKNLEDKF